jgi:ATP-dependent RNA helicase DDX46/PRP5
VQGIRPDRQTVLFSATFPRSVEVLARTVLQDPVEVQVGGRSIVNSDISQFVEVSPPFARPLLKSFSEWT